MNRFSWRVLFVVVLLVICNAAALPQPKGSSSTAYGINPEAIDRVEILYFPERIATRAALTVERLERAYRYRIEIRDFSSCLQRPQLVAALGQASFSKSDRSGDLRTAVLLYGKDGRRLLSLYFDQSGRSGRRSGMVNRDPVLTSDAVYRWAKLMMRGFAD